MFNFVPYNDVPGFRVRLPEATPGFSIDDNGAPRPRPVSFSGYDPVNLLGFSRRNPTGQQSWIAREFGQDLAVPLSLNMTDVGGRSKHDECVEKCLHLLPSPSGELQSSEFRKCYRECMGSLG
jgi:hypothetical protein